MTKLWSRTSGWLVTGWPRRSAAIASGLLIALAFPHFDLWPLCWFAFVPLLYALEGQKPAPGFRLALLTGATANFVGFFWMVNMLHDFGHLPYWPSVAIILAGSTYQGLSIAAAMALAQFLRRRKSWPLWVTLPFLYTGIEAVHPILFPWYLGNCQYQLLWLTQICDIAGISALTFILVLANGVLFTLARGLTGGTLAKAPTKALAPAVTLLTLLAVVLTYGAIRLGHIDEQEAAAQHLKVGIIEPEIDIFEAQQKKFPRGTSPLAIYKWNTLSLHEMSRTVAREKPDLLIWPESTYFPALSTYARRWADRYLLADRVLHRAGSDGPIGPPVPLAQQALAGASAGEHLTFLVGNGGAIWKVDKGTTIPEDSGTQATLRGAWVACQGSAELQDTPFDQCFVLAVGESGTVLVRGPSGWVRLATNTDPDWQAVASPGLPDVLVGGDYHLAAGSVTAGLTVHHSTPNDRWLQGVVLDHEAALISDRGAVAVLSESGAVTVKEPPPELPGEVRGAATDGRGELLLATSRGLVGQRGEVLRTLKAGVGFSNVACAGPGDCLAITDQGEWWAVETFSGQARAVFAGGSPINAMVGVPFSRHYWWLPADAVTLFQSRAPLPRPHAFPEAVEQDALTPVADRNAVQRQLAVPLLFGATSGSLKELEKPNSLENARYNSAFLLDGQGEVLGRYDKQYLLAFGEYVPFGDIFPKLYDWSPDSGRFSPGPARSPLLFEGHRLGILICYEDIIPAHTNAIVEQGVDVLLNLTNDAWFGKTKEPLQHFVLASFRAIEQRRALVRATTTGISGVVSAGGRISHMTHLHEAETFVADVPLLQGETFYRMGGRFFAHACLLLGLLGVGIALRRRS